MPHEMPFINRIDDLRFLKSQVNERRDKSYVIVVSAPSGVGKSRLVNTALDGFSRLPVVHVRVVDHPGFVADEGEYVGRIFREIADMSPHDSRLPSYELFCREREGLAAGKEVFKGVVQSAETAVVNKLGTEADDLTHYALEALEQCPCVIRIENIQKIDRRSLEQISRIFAICRGALGLFEYTEGGDGVSLSAINSALCDGDRGILYRLPMVHPDEVVRSIRDLDGISVSEVVRSYEAERGNMRVLVDYRVRMSVKGVQGFGSDERLATTRSIFRALPNQKRLLFAMVAVHGAEVEGELLTAALAAVGTEKTQALGLVDVHGELADLCSIDYLKDDGTRVRSAHDSVTNAFMGDLSNAKYITIAYSIWIDFYRSVVDSGDPFVARTEALHWLAVFYSAADQPAQLIWVLEQCGHGALQSLAPRRVVGLFKQIFDMVEKTGGATSVERLNLLIEHQGRVLYDANWLDEACECYERAASLPLEAQLAYADACVGTGRAERGFQLLDQLEVERRDIPAVLRLGLVRLHGLRADGKPEECEKLYHRLLRLKKQLSDRERAFLLRAADVGLFKDDAIPEIISLLLEAVDICCREGLKADEAAARLALCQHFGYAGRLADAEEQLSAVEALAEEVWIERYSILNNRAVLAMMDRCDRDAAKRLLLRALMLATEDGDRLLLLCNLLGVGHAAAAPDLSRLVDGIDGLGDELAKVAHYNLALFYQDSGQIELAAYHRGRAIEMADEPDSRFWRGALGGELPPDEGTRLRLSLRYNLVFIVHWRLTSDTFEGIR